MSDKARNYTEPTKKRLFALSGNQCAFPGCTNKLIAEDGITVVGQIAHIQSANKGGARYYPEISDKERADFPNLLLMCDEHHKIIDNKANEDNYPIELLKKWKSEHDAKHEKDKFEVSDTIIEQITVKLENYLKDLAEKFIDATLEANKTILDEIFDFIFKEKIDEEKAKIKFDQDGIAITKKIKINFEENQRKRVSQLFSDYLEYEYIIREFIEIEENQNSFRIAALKSIIQDIYCEVQQTDDTETIIKDYNVFTKIAKELLPIKKQHNPTYLFNAKLIVLYFFELCEIGKKTKAENKNNQLRIDL